MHQPDKDSRRTECEGVAQPAAEKTRIVILGGGFAGVEAARYLDRTAAKRANVDVTLVSRDNFSLFTPMLHEVVASDLEPADICNPVRKLLRRVTFVSGEIRTIDLAARRVAFRYLNQSLFGFSTFQRSRSQQSKFPVFTISERWPRQAKGDALEQRG